MMSAEALRRVDPQPDEVSLPGPGALPMYPV